MFDFRPNSLSSRKQWLLWTTSGKSWVADRSVPMTLSDLKRWDSKGQTYLSDLRVRSYRLTNNDQTQSGNTRGEGLFLAGHPRPFHAPSQGTGNQSIQSTTPTRYDTQRPSVA